MGVENSSQKCSCHLGSAWADATSLGLVDLLLTPMWSELDLIPRLMVLSRGKEWCANPEGYHEYSSDVATSNLTCVSENDFKKGLEDDEPPPGMEFPPEDADDEREEEESGSES